MDIITALGCVSCLLPGLYGCKASRLYIYATGFYRHKLVETAHEFLAVARAENVGDGLFEAGADRGRVMTVVQAVRD